MADAKVTALAENTTPAASDVVPLVDDPAGTPATQKATIQNILSTPFTPYAHGNTGATETVSLANGRVHTATVNADCVITVSGFTNGQYAELILQVTQDGTGNRAITWSGPTFASDSAPNMAAASVTTYVFWSFTGDAGIQGAKIGTASAVATDAIWDAAGDLAVGSGANAAARLAIGAAGGALSRINGAVAWNSGTAFPAAAAGDRYWRTDLTEQDSYDGTRWVGPELPMPFAIYDSQGSVSLPLSLTNSRLWAPVYGGGFNIYVTKISLGYYVNTTNDGTKYWTFQVKDDAGTNVGAAHDTSAKSPNTWYQFDIAVNALIGTTRTALQIGAVKTSTPGSVYLAGAYFYRVVRT